MKRWVIGITGASGIRYGLRLLDVVSSKDIEVHLVLSESARWVMREEEGIKIPHGPVSSEILIGENRENIVVHAPENISAPIASGSFVTEGMVVIPCSMSTLGAIATGASQHLVHRAADVALKEGRRLILVPRETPLSAVHLENMLKLSRLGVHIVPAMPGFYHRPKSIEELIDMQVLKTLDVMGIDSDLAKRWGS